MDSLQMLAATILYEDTNKETLASRHDAIDAVFHFPETWDARSVWFQLVNVPTSTQTYPYLMAWINTTPPRQLSLVDFLPDLIEPDLLERMQAGGVVGYAPRWCGGGWVLEADLT